MIHLMPNAYDRADNLEILHMMISSLGITDSPECDPAKRFTEYHDFDSINRVELAMYVEKEFHCVVPDEEMHSWTSLNDILDFIETTGS